MVLIGIFGKLLKICNLCILDYSYAYKQEVLINLNIVCNQLHDDFTYICLYESKLLYNRGYAK